ncbi:putative receptor-like protein kinase At5g59700 [Bidens hawaiensis]|uniref:putative receptor-like protein kinase At5g59700 n=1 Tax=Bidens hawaiensis TaxID=980011 RepID=UPI0040499D2C
MAALQLPMFRQISLDEIRAATNDFAESEKIGAGGFGTVRRGEILYGTNHVHVAIKRLNAASVQTGFKQRRIHEFLSVGALLLDASISKSQDFYAEVNALSNLRYCNLVLLTGYCDEATKKVLVYEMVENENLDDHLHMHGTDLSWMQRLQICISAGRGLQYLHEFSSDEIGIIHGDSKPANVLLTQNWTSKVSDFGFARFCSKVPLSEVPTQVKGTDVYIDPTFLQTRMLFEKVN